MSRTQKIKPAKCTKVCPVKGRLLRDRDLFLVWFLIPFKAVGLRYNQWAVTF